MEYVPMAFSNAQIQRSYEQFREYSQDMMSCDSNSWPHPFNDLFEFCENDPVMRAVTTELRDNPEVDFEKWIRDFDESGSSKIGSHTYRLPADATQRGAILYSMFTAIYDQKLNVSGFAMDAYGVTHHDECIYEFNKNITAKLIRIIERKIEAMIDQQSLGGPEEEVAVELRAHQRTIFIGHGRAGDWRDLKDFLRDRLHLPVDEFNAVAAAGMTTKERLEEMLDNASFAFLVMTAEDEQADGTKRARENVIHEVGLFQGRLGFRRAIILMEDGCAEFSNISGLIQLRYPKGHISAKFEEIRGVLEREGII